MDKNMLKRIMVVAAAIAVFVIITWPFVGIAYMIIGLMVGIFGGAALMVYLLAASYFWIVTAHWSWKFWKTEEWKDAS